MKKSVIFNDIVSGLRTSEEVIYSLIIKAQTTSSVTATCICCSNSVVDYSASQM